MPTYTGVSIVDYLKSVGQPSDFTSRSTLAAQKGITDYAGTAEQNTQLLNLLRGGNQEVANPVANQVASPVVPLDQISQTKQQIEDITNKILEAQTQLSKAKAAGFAPNEQIPGTINQQTGEVVKTSTEIGKEKTQARIAELEKSAFQTPTKDYTAIFKEQYDISDLPATKQKIADLDAKILKLKNDLYDEEGEISENPWLTEASRVGRVKRLYSMAQKDLDNLIEERTGLRDQYNADLSLLQNGVETSITGQETARQISKEELEYLSKLAEGTETSLWPEGATTEYKDYVLQGSEAGTGQTYAEWQEAQKAETVKPSYQYFTDNEGNVVQFDENTGKTVNLGNVGKGKEAGVAETGGAETLKASDTTIRNWILENKRANPNMPYYDLWGKLVDEMKKQGLNPSNYDKIFWEILHPEGEAGYTKYVQGTSDDPY